MRKHFVQVNGVLVEDGQTAPSCAAPEVLPDIKPYKSMITGEMITSRSRHREHLKEHGCFEVGNDSSLHRTRSGIPDCNPQGRKELIRAQIDAMTHAELRAAIKRDVDRIKWNSRED